MSRWGRGRISASLPIPRFSISSTTSATDNDRRIAAPTSTPIPDAASLDWDEKILAIIDIHEHIGSGNDKITKTKRTGKPSGLEYVHKGNDSECFSSKLRKILLPCFPQSERAGDSDSNSSHEEQGDSDHTDDERITQIECILEQYRDNEPSDDLPTSSSLKVDTHLPLCIDKVPPLSDWNQTPLLLTATPGSSGMCIRRIRRISERSYFETPEPHHSNACDYKKSFSYLSTMGKNTHQIPGSLILRRIYLLELHCSGFADVMAGNRQGTVDAIPQHMITLPNKTASSKW